MLKKFQVIRMIMGSISGDSKRVMKRYSLEKCRENQENPNLSLLRTRKPNLYDRDKLRELHKLCKNNVYGNNIPSYMVIEDVIDDKTYVWFSDDSEFLPYNTEKEKKQVKKVANKKNCDFEPLEQPLERVVA